MCPVIIWQSLLFLSTINSIKSKKNDNPDNLSEYVTYSGYSQFQQPNEETGQKVAQWHINYSVNPEELGDYVEGDIIYPIKITRNGIRLGSARWSKGIIPYQISSNFGL